MDLIKKGILVLLFAASTGWASQEPNVELLLAGGSFYSSARRAYRSLHLPAGWHVAGGAYSPDGQSTALVLIGEAVTPPVPPVPAPAPQTLGPINKAVRAWRPSTHLAVIDRASGRLTRTWVLTSSQTAGSWSLAWTAPRKLRATSREAGGPPLVLDISLESNASPQPENGTPDAAVVSDSGDCGRILTETRYIGRTLRFVKQGASCETPPETADVYRLIVPGDGSVKDEILWEYRVPIRPGACAEPYACYTGADAQFLSVGGRRFLVWDGDLFAIEETDDGVEARLVTQLLPQFSHPWGAAAGETNLNFLDAETAMPSQPVDSRLRVHPGAGLRLYAQNFLPTRSFNATVEIGADQQSLMVPAGSQVGPIVIDSFKDRSYTPMLSSVRWTSFHHLSDPITCHQPYTVSSFTTTAMVVSLHADPKGNLQCEIRFQEDR